MSAVDEGLYNTLRKYTCRYDFSPWLFSGKLIQVIYCNSVDHSVYIITEDIVWSLLQATILLVKNILIDTCS